VGFKESYDDNILLVSGNGLPVQSSWVDTVSLKAGFDIARLLPGAGALQAFTVAYLVEHASYEQAHAEDYTANRLNTLLKVGAGPVTVGVDNAFLYNDGNKLAETYALNQLSGAQANQNDKYRSSLSHAAPRERRDQTQDRGSGFVQYDAGGVFVRAATALSVIDIDTYKFNTSAAPYKGYQDYVNRYDWNGGLDLGLRVTPGWAVTLGYRDGLQYQPQFSHAINNDSHASSNHYRRVLLGLEGNIPWLTVRLAAGPDFRSFNPDTPISDLRTTRFYGDASATARLPGTQTLTLAYKEWIFVSSTGLVPYQDTGASLAYHWSPMTQFGLDLGARYLNHNYTLGNDTAGTAPSLRDDGAWVWTAGLSYSLAKGLTAGLGFSEEDGRNLLGSLAAAYAPSYRSFRDRVMTASIQFRF
jgi:hypothetical protein